jgi:uncharacterized protein (TIGR03437 family)
MKPKKLETARTMLLRKLQYFFKGLLPYLLLCASGTANPSDRVTSPVDPRQTTPVRGSVHRMAQPQFDRGSVDPAFPMNHMVLFVKPSAAQQAELDRLLADQQNPSSPRFHQWLSPEEFGNRFGLTAGDHSQVVAWLHSQGFTIDQSARARNWIMFSGSAGQVQQALHTEIHRFEVNGEKHYANISDPAVPAALAGLVGGFEGLHDFQPKPALRKSTPDNNVGSTHYLVPADYATIYDINPVYASGIDGTGVNIGIVGTSTLLLGDIDTFRSKYGLPANDPKSVLAGNNPGLNTGSLEEADLDIEWSGAIAPGAAIYYYYSTSLITAISAAVNANLVHMISMSFGGSELDNPALAYQPIFQQANAQGITMFASTGDYGAASFPDGSSFSRFGPAVQWPASYPEVTAVGGTQFNEGTNSSTYWASSNASDSSSALMYIPEIAWSGSNGGPSVIFSKPAWQSGPGVPQDQARDLPDVSMAASCHDGFVIIYLGVTLNGICGTSASAPSMAGVAALLNHSLVNGGQLSRPGLGNINPQLYRLAQSSPTAFHDITSGGNTVTCTQGSPGCSSGTFGYLAGPGYDMATGIGSLDVNNFVTQWSSATNPVSVTFTVSPTKGTLNDTFQLTASVAPAGGSGTPTGTVDFSGGSIPLASIPLANGSASFSLPGYLLGTTGNLTLVAQYRGDAAFSGGGATAKLQVTAPTGVASIVPSVPVSVTATPDPSGLFWEFSMTLSERGGVAAVLTNVNVDGQDQPVAQYFPDPSIPPNSTVTSRFIIYRNLAYPLLRTLVFSGVDATGQSWSRQARITFLGPSTGTQAVIFSAVPLVMQQNPSADPSCQWTQELVLTEITGYPQTISGLVLGNLPINDQIPAIFGTTQLAAYGSLQGTICWAAASPGTTDTVSLLFAAGWTQDIAVSFAGPAANPAPISASPSSIKLSATSQASPPAQATLSISVPAGQSWSIGISPQNLISGWLSLSQASGTGSAQITVQASPGGFEPGAYHADLVIQGPNLAPAAITVPVMFVLGDSSAATITSVTNAASGQSVAAPGMLAVIKGKALGTASVYYVNGVYYPGSLAGVLVTVNGVPAAVQSVSPTQIAFQIPYETGTGDAVVGVSYNGSAAGYPIQVTPSAPGIYADSSGNATPTASVQAGKTVTLTMTGDGVTSPSIADGSTPSTSSSLAFKPALPFTLTIGGVPAFLTSYGIAAGSYGVTTLNVTIPASAPTGPQPVVVTVGGVASPPVNLTITAPSASSQ